MRMRFVLLALVGLAFSPFGAQAATVTVLSDESALKARLGSFTYTDFSQAPTSSPAHGAPHAPTRYGYDGFTITREYTRKGTGPRRQAYRGKPTASLADVITFATPIRGWGGWINTQEGGGGKGIQLFSHGVLVGSVGLNHKNAPNDPNAAYTGFISEVPFQEVRLLSTNTNGDTYTLDNMTYGTAVVPLPGAMALLLTGLGAATMLRRRTR